MRAWCQRFFFARGRNRPRASVSSGVANTGVHSANFRSRAAARWPLADHRNRGTSRRVYRYLLDVDPYRASREWKSVDANRSVRRAGEGLLSHRVYDHRLDTRTNRGELRRS